MIRKEFSSLCKVLSAAKSAQESAALSGKFVNNFAAEVCCSSWRCSFVAKMLQTVHSWDMEELSQRNRCPDLWPAKLSQERIHLHWQYIQRGVANIISIIELHTSISKMHNSVGLVDVCQTLVTQMDTFGKLLERAVAGGQHTCQRTMVN